MSPTPRQMLDAIIAELGPLTPGEEARIEGSFYGHLFRLTDSAARDYDPQLDLTVGELRAIGKVVDPKLPDCAWVPRSAMRMGAVRAERKAGGGPRDVNISWDVTFVEPFRWTEIKGALVE